MSEIVAVTFTGGVLPGQIAIEAGTASRWAHVWAETDTGEIIDATAKHGVSERPMPTDGHLWQQRYDITAAPVDKRRFMAALLRSQKGKPYDWQWIFAYPLDRDWQEDDSWVCSELIAWAMFHAALIPNFHQHRVTPANLQDVVRMKYGHI